MKSAEQHINDLLNQCWDEMIAHPQQAAEIAIQAQELAVLNSEQFCQAKCFLGLCRIYQGHFESALEVLNVALAISIEHNQSTNSRRINNALGMCYHSLGQYAAAFEHFEFSANTARKLEDLPQLIPPLINMSRLLFDMGDMEAADQTLTEVIGFDHQGVDQDNLVEVYLLQTQIILSALRFSEAEVALAQTEALAQELNFHYVILHCQIQRGRMFRLKGELTESIALFERIIEEEDLHSEGVDALEVYIEFAKAHFSLGNIENALDILKEGVRRIDPPEHSPRYLKLLEQMAIAHNELGDSESEAACLRKIMNIERSSATLQTQNIFHLKDIKPKQEQDALNKVLLDRENQLLKESHERLNLLNDIAHQITMTLNFEQLGQRLFGILTESMDVHFISLVTFDEARKMLNFRFIIDSGVSIEGDDLVYGVEGSNSSRAVRERKPILIEDAKTLDSLNQVGSNEVQPRSMLFVPLILEDEVLGVFSMQSPIPNRFTSYEVQLLVAISKFIAVAVSNIISHDRVQQLNHILFQEKQAMETAQERIAHMAYHDALTALPNRQALDDLIEERMNHSTQSFNLVYIDLDGFKPVNDMHGHRVGDLVLIEISKRLKNALRAKDFAFRVGGDEFVLIVDAFHTEMDLRTFLTRLLAVIELPIEAGGAIVNVSASIGSALYPLKGESLDELMHAADLAMYEIKRSGKGGIKTS